MKKLKKEIDEYKKANVLALKKLIEELGKEE